MSSTCTVCRDVAARDVIDNALRIGERPNAVFEKYGPSLGISRSALYRHSRGHVRRAPVYVGERTTGEWIADLAALARGQFEAFSDARDAGQSAAAARYSAEASRTMSKLMEMGFPNESAADSLRYLEEASMTFNWILHGHRELIPAAAKIARDRDYDALAADLEELPSALADWDSRNTPAHH